MLNTIIILIDKGYHQYELISQYLIDKSYRRHKRAARLLKTYRMLKKLGPITREDLKLLGVIK